MLVSVTVLLLAIEVAMGKTGNDDLSVMTFNIMQLPHEQLPSLDWDQTQRRERIPDAIRALEKTGQQPDVVVFTEVIEPKADSMIRSLGDVYPHQTPIIGKRCDGSDWDRFEGAACSNSPFVTSGGVKIVSKYPIIAKMGRVFQASNPDTWDYRANKGAVYARIQKSTGLTYSIFGTHLQADESGKPGHSFRMQQLQELKDWIQRLNLGADEPIIIAGDLNVELSKTSDCNDMIKTIQADITCDQFKQSLGPNPSYTAKSNALAKAVCYHFSFPLDYEDTLDYVFSFHRGRKPLSVDGPHGLPMLSRDPMYWSYMRRKRITPDGYYRDLSDHSAVYATFASFIFIQSALHVRWITLNHFRMS